MELDWTTLLLEILNFLILIWLLSHFLYRPVQAIIEQRRARIQQTLQDAERAQADAQTLKNQYDHRLIDWEQEKTEAHQKLLLELRAERQQALEQLQQALTLEQEKARILGERQQQEARQADERAALAQGAAFSTRLLARLAGPELESRIVGLVLADLAQLSAEQRTRLRQQQEQGELVEISSAYPLADAQQQQLHQLLTALLDRPCQLRFRQQPDLLAGLRIAIGPWRLAANLGDELKLFAESGHAL